LDPTEESVVDPQIFMRFLYEKLQCRNICEICLTFGYSFAPEPNSNPLPCRVYAFYRSKEEVRSMESGSCAIFETWNRSLIDGTAEGELSSFASFGENTADVRRDDDEDGQLEAPWRAHVCLSCRRTLNKRCPDPIDPELRQNLLNTREVRMRYCLGTKSMMALNRRFPIGVYPETEVLLRARQVFGGDAGINVLRALRQPPTEVGLVPLNS